MGGTRSTSVSPLHPLHLLIFLLLLVLARMSPQSQQEDLSCVNDYLGNVSCVWNCVNQSEKAKHHQCILTGNSSKSAGKESVQCMMMSQSEDPCYKGCHFKFKSKDYTWVNIAKLDVKCAGKIVTELNKYRFGKHIKLQAPGIPSITRGNLSWSVGTHVPKYMADFIFERQFKREDQPWETANGQTHKEKIESLVPLYLGVRYQARVRVMPETTNKPSSYRATWSEWSPVLTWTSDVGDPPPPSQTPAPKHTGVLLSDMMIGLVCGALGLAVVMILCFSRKSHCSSGFLRKKQHVPDPSGFFQPLHSVHGGDFQKWLSPMFGPEAFAAPQPCDSISPVEVAPILYTEAYQAPDTLVALQGKSSGSFTGSGQSSCYSNMGYFYSEFQPGHLHIESCPIYFTYPTEAEENVPEADISGTSVTSYERLEQLEQTEQFHFSVACLMNHQGEPLSPDSGFGMEGGEVGGVNEEGDVVEKEGEEWRRGKEELPFTVHFQNIGIPIPIQTPLSFMTPPEFGTPTQEWEDATPVLTCSDAPPPPESNLPRSASLVIQPCDGGYMTLKEMQNTYSNKSI